MPSPGFEPVSPKPQSKSDDLDPSAMGPARVFLEFAMGLEAVLGNFSFIFEIFTYMATTYRKI